MFPAHLVSTYVYISFSVQRAVNAARARARPGCGRGARQEERRAPPAKDRRHQEGQPLLYTGPGRGRGAGYGPGKSQQEGQDQHSRRSQQTQKDLRQDAHQHPAPQTLQVIQTHPITS